VRSSIAFPVHVRIGAGPITTTRQSEGNSEVNNLACPHVMAARAGLEI
jgi:hypothetical protein